MDLVVHSTTVQSTVTFVEGAPGLSFTEACVQITDLLEADPCVVGDIEARWNSADSEIATIHYTRRNSADVFDDVVLTITPSNTRQSMEPQPGTETGLINDPYEGPWE